MKIAPPKWRAGCAHDARWRAFSKR